MIPLIALFCLLAPVAANANPYLAKPGEPPVSIHPVVAKAIDWVLHLQTGPRTFALVANVGVTAIPLSSGDCSNFLVG